MPPKHEPMTDLDLLRSEVSASRSVWEDCEQAAAMGADISHSQNTLERYAREAFARYDRALRELDAYLACPLEPSHDGLRFWTDGAGRRCCSCYDCDDAEPNDEGTMCATNIIGRGKDDNEAFEDFWRQWEEQ